MQIKINFSSEEDIVLPVHYNHIVQAFIYNNIDEKLALFLHNKGYISNNRSFKLFTFSNILNRGNFKDKFLRFGEKIELIVSSPIEDFCKSIANSMLLKDDLILGKNKIKVEQIQMIDKQIKNDEIEVKTISPITIYSTLFKVDGKKFTYYYQTREKEFQKLIGENLIKKYNAFYKEYPQVYKNIEIIPLSTIKQNIVYYKNFIIKGETGRFRIRGDKKLLQIGIDSGFGSKNSQGFGCVKLI